MKKVFSSFFLSLFFLVLLIFSNSVVRAQSGQPSEQEQVYIHLFSSATCPHCHEEKEFLRQYLSDEKISEQVIIYDYLVDNRQNALLMSLVAQELGIQGGGVPLTIIGSEALVGFGSAQTTGQKIDRLVQAELSGEFQVSDQINIEQLVAQNNLEPRRERLEPAPILQPTTTPQEAESEPDQASESGSKSETNLTPKPSSGKTVDLPLIGQLELEKLSLPVLSVVLGVIDGFNPCAMWTLLFLISLLLGMKNKARMWLLGTSFIFASGFVYFLFMTAWLNFFLFVGFIKWVRILIGAVALGAGGYYLYDYVTNPEGTCKVEAGGKKKKVFNQLKKVAYQPQLLLAILGMIGLAFAVNLVELICSAGLPAVFTQVLAMSNLPTWQYYSYIVLYIVFFMIDDLLIFIVAMTTLHKVGLDTRYARYSHLIGGILMALIGLAMWFKPELLTFG